MGEKACRSLRGHGFSNEAREERRLSRSEFQGWRQPSPGVARGMALLVGGQSPRRGGRELSDCWKGESGAFSLQKAAVGNERVEESRPRAWPGVNRDRTHQVILLAILESVGPESLLFNPFFGCLQQGLDVRLVRINFERPAQKRHRFFRFVQVKMTLGGQVENTCFGRFGP